MNTKEYVVTDPKGTVLVECGKMLARGRPARGKNGEVLYTVEIIPDVIAIEFTSV